MFEVELEERPPAVPQRPAQKELVPVYFLRMRLPSRYLLQEVVAERRREIRIFNDERAPKLETIRWHVYRRIERVFCMVEEYGVWVAVTDEAVREAQELSAFVKSRLRRLGFDEETISRYDVRAIQVFLRPEDARELLQAAVRRLSQDVEELARKIAEAEREGKKAALWRLQQDAAYKRALLEAFRRYLSAIS